MAGAAALLLLGIVVAIVASRQPEATFPNGSPEAAVAAYVRLLQDGQVDDAYAKTAFAAPAGSPDKSMTRERFQQEFAQWGQRPHRVTLIRSSVNGDQANVVVEIATFTTSLMGASDQTQQQTFTLTRQGAAWLITGPEFLF